MKKLILLIFVLIIIAGLVQSFATKGSGINVQPAPVETSNDREVKGTVTAIDTEHVPVDGPALVMMRTEDGSEATVAIRSMGINLCPAQASIADVDTLKAGDKVEARGEVGVEGMILPCESSEHYLRVVAQ